MIQMKKFLTILISLILVLPWAQAWGISYAENQFTLEPGQELEVKFGLQNYVGDESQRIIVKLSGDSEIASILDPQDYYLLPPKTKDIPVIIKIALPDPARKKYEVQVNFIDYQGGGGVGLATAKVIPIKIDVPQGTLAEEKAPEKPLDLGSTYQTVEKQIAENEGQSASPKIQGLAILDEKSVKTLLPAVIIIVVIIISAIALTIYFQKKRQKKIEL